jgi:hypothetical protein
LKSRELALQGGQVSRSLFPENLGQIGSDRKTRARQLYRFSRQGGNRSRSDNAGVDSQFGRCRLTLAPLLAWRQHSPAVTARVFSLPPLKASGQIDHAARIGYLALPGLQMLDPGGKKRCEPVRSGRGDLA